MPGPMKSLHSDRSDLSDRRSEYGLRDDDRARRPLSFTSAAILIEKHPIGNRGGEEISETRGLPNSARSIVARVPRISLAGISRSVIARLLRARLSIAPLGDPAAASLRVRALDTITSISKSRSCRIGFTCDFPYLRQSRRGALPARTRR